jgi:hypothetical protein
MPKIFLGGILSSKPRQENEPSASMTTMLSSLLNMTVGLAMVGVVTKSFKTLDMFLDLGTSDIAWRLQRGEKDLNEYVEKLQKRPSVGAVGLLASIIQNLEGTYRRLVPIAERKGLADLAEAFKDMQALCSEAYHVYDRAGSAHSLPEDWAQSPLMAYFSNYPIKAFGKEFVEEVFKSLVKARESVSRAVGRYIILYSQSVDTFSPLDLVRDIAELHSTLIPVIREKLKI